jgi:hypothetical protein
MNVPKLQLIVLVFKYSILYPQRMKRHKHDARLLKTIVHHIQQHK